LHVNIKLTEVEQSELMVNGQKAATSAAQQSCMVDRQQAAPGVIGRNAAGKVIE
jgi:hypothetical protein